MKPDKPPPPTATAAAKPGKPGEPKPYDSLLDPLPLPDVSESDTDTAWSLWEASVDGADSKPATEPVPDFEKTVPATLEQLRRKD